VLEDRLDAPAAARAWAEAIATQPRDPLVELAAQRLLEVEGDSAEVDDAILDAEAHAPAGLLPRAARLLREAAARVHGARVGVEPPEVEARAWARLGAIQRWRIAGPFAALRLLDSSRTLALDGPGLAAAPAVGPAGPTFSRALHFPDGDVGLDAEPGDGDVYYAASDLSVSQGGDYLAWIEGAGALELRIDGDVVISRVPYPHEVPRGQTAAVALGPGRHDVLVRWSRAEGARFRFSLVRRDGAPSDVASEAPAELRGRRKSAPCALGETCVAAPAWKETGLLRAVAEEQLATDPGDPLAAYLLARASRADDRDATRAAVARAVQTSASGAPALMLRAEEEARDPEVPDRIGRSRALADFAEAARRDPLLVRARVGVAALERDSERFDDAAQELERAEAAVRRASGRAAPSGSAVQASVRPADAAPLPARLSLAWARLLDARGNPAAARRRVEAALAVQPSRCDGQQLAWQLARRDGGVRELAPIAERLRRCPDGIATSAAFERDRGNLARAEELFAALARARPAQAAALQSLAEVQNSRGEIAAAVQSLEAAAQLAPRSAEPLRRMAGVLDGAHDAEAAARARARALARAPGDLQLRRQLSLGRAEKLLAWSDRDGLAIARDASIGAPAGASAVRLLDQGAAEFFPDGGGAERVHTVARVFDKKGVAKFGEAQIPGDAQILHLRTIKKDGRTLEPESIPEKETITLPALEPGDAVEIDYLRPLALRGPDVPGATLAGFFFRDDETPMVESTYEVRAPPGTPLAIDAHGFTADPLDKLPDGTVRWRRTVRNVAPLPAEPHQPGESEVMPWVQVGWGAGQDDLVRSVADWALLRTRRASATDELARKAGGKSPRERAERIYEAVVSAVRGRSQGTDFGASAANVLAQGRGNRLVALKAALASAGIGSHIVLARTFAQDAGAYRFPRGDLYGWALLRIDLPGGPAWIDPSFRLSPFDDVPAFARGQDAWVVPELGEEPQHVRLPVSGQPDGHDVGFSLAIDAEGVASGEGRDVHKGFDAAALRDALERLDDPQRKQAVESMLGRSLRGLELLSLGVDGETTPSGPATLLYEVRVQLARRDANRLLVPASLMPQRLSRRWVQKAERTATLVLDSPEDQSVRAEIALPAGKRMRGLAKDVELRTPFGQYRWRAREERGRLLVEESLSLPQQRISPAQYAAFADFCRRVDDAQSQELALE
jgi:cellulose synthase operon protein C